MPRKKLAAILMSLAVVGAVAVPAASAETQPAPTAVTTQLSGSVLGGGVVSFSWHCC